jgi:UDP-GlcNAc3NAcA epimerase
MKLLTILGARPQFIKAAAVSRAIKSYQNINEVIVHTGQHYDANMSKVFFEQLEIPLPHHNLQIAGLSHGAMTGRMIEGVESLIMLERPDCVMVYGDTNSTLAGAIAASKLKIPVVHVEAGLRSNNPAMPEEINRILTDRVSTLLLCPSKNAINNLEKEGFPFWASGKNSKPMTQRVINVGDVMFDVVQYFSERAKVDIDLNSFGLKHHEYVLCTLHRQENTDVPMRLTSILAALNFISKHITVVLPLHPRTKARIEQICDQDVLSRFHILEPLPYLEMQRLQMSARHILTDSGGVQKEAYFHRIPCITLRDETEWIETVDAGWNQLAGANTEEIIEAWSHSSAPKSTAENFYGDGKAAEIIIQSILNC